MSMFNDSMLVADAVVFLGKIRDGEFVDDGNRLFPALTVALERLALLEGVADLSRRVRDAQRRYFKDRTNESLIASKELERKLDAQLKE